MSGADGDSIVTTIIVTTTIVDDKGLVNETRAVVRSRPASSVRRSFYPYICLGYHDRTCHYRLQEAREWDSVLDPIRKRTVEEIRGGVVDEKWLLL